MRIVASVVCSLFVLEGLHFFWSAYAFARLFRSAGNVEASDALPLGVWSDVFVGGVLIALGIAYAFDLGRLRQVFLPFGALALLYGCWAVWSGSQIMFSFEAALQGDLVSLGVLSGVGFVAIGSLGSLYALASTRRSD